MKKTDFLVKKSPGEILVTSRQSKTMNKTIILLIVFYSNTSRSKHISIHRLSYIHDIIVCNKDIDKKDRGFINPWEASKSLKPLIVKMLESGLISYDINQGKIRITITMLGSNTAKEIINKNKSRLEKLIKKIEIATKITNESQFKKPRISV